MAVASNGGTHTLNMQSAEVNISGSLTNTGGTGILNVDGGTSSTTVATNLTIGASSTFTSTSNTLTIGGNFTNSGTFTHNSGTVKFNATATGKTITPASSGSPFNHLIFNGSGGGWTVTTNPLTAAGNLTVTNGTFNGGSVGLNVTGNISIGGGTFTSTSGIATTTGSFIKTGGTFTHNSGTVVLSGTGDFSTDAAITFYNLTFGNGAGGRTTTITTTHTLSISNVLTFNAGTVDTPSISILLTGTGTPVVFASPTTLTGTDSKLTFSSITASGTVNIPGADYGTWDIRVSSTSVNDVTYQLSGDVTMSDLFLVQATTGITGTVFSTNGHDLTTTSSFLFCDGGSRLGAVTVNFTAGSTVSAGMMQTLCAASYTLNLNSSTIVLTGNMDLTNASGVVAVNGGTATVTIGGNLIIGTNFTSTSGTLTIGGNFTKTGGTFTHNSGTVVLNSGTTATISSDAAISFNNFTVSGVGAAKTIKFKNTTPIFTFVGTVTLNGASGQILTIDSDNSTDQWIAHFNNAVSPTWVSVSNSGCDAGTANATVDANSTLVTNNGSCWTSSTGLIISGTLYSDEGTTALTGTVLTIRVAKNSTLSQSASLDTDDGTFTLPTIASVSAGDKLTVFVDDDTNYAATLTKNTPATGSLTLNLYKNELIVRSETEGSTTTIDFDSLTPFDPLDDEYPADVIDWGTGAWVISEPWNLLTTNNLAFSTSVSDPLEETFSFITPKRLVSIDAYNGGAGQSTISLACAGNTTKNEVVPANTLVTIETGWDANCLEVSLSSSNGYDTNFDNFVYDGAEGGTILNTDLGLYDGDDDPQIKYTSNSGALSVTAGKLLVWAGKTFAPGGTITTASNSGANSALTGDIGIQTGATMDMAANALSVGGDLAADGTFSGGSAAASVAGSVSIGGGTFTSTSNTLTIGGNFTKTGGTFTHNSGTVAFNTGTTATISSDDDTTFNNFTASGLGAAKAIKFKNTAPVFTFAGTVTLNGASGQMLSIDSDDSTNRWLAHFNNAVSLTWVLVANSGCDPGTANATVDTNSTLGNNNGSCWKGGRSSPGGGGSGGGSSAGGESSSGGGPAQGGGGQGGGGDTEPPPPPPPTPPPPGGGEGGGGDSGYREDGKFFSHQDLVNMRETLAVVYSLLVLLETR
jgi:hypothetical protein